MRFCARTGCWRSGKSLSLTAENSFWTFCVEYLESAPAAPRRRASKLPKVDYKEVLKPEEFEVFSRLRDWRKGVAEKEGVPVYVVFTNEQLAEMVKKTGEHEGGLERDRRRGRVARGKIRRRRAGAAGLQPGARMKPRATFLPRSNAEGRARHSVRAAARPNPTARTE